MSYDIRYNLINTFKAIDQWRTNVITNMGSALTPGFKVINSEFGHSVSVQNTGTPRAAGARSGSRPAVQTAVGSMYLARTQIRLDDNITKLIRQGKLESGPTDMAIAGSANSFFAVAESLNNGARVFLTRGGNFKWKQEKGANGEVSYRLMTENGLYVLRNVDFDSSKMTVTNNEELKNADPNTGQGFDDLLKFYTRLGWVTNKNQANYLAEFDKDPRKLATVAQKKAWGDWLKNFIKPGLVGGDARPDPNLAQTQNPLPLQGDFADPAIMRDAVFGSPQNSTSKHTADDKIQCSCDLRGLVLSGEGNENQYTAKGPSHIAVVKVPDASFLQTSSYGSAIYEIPKVYRESIQVSNEQRLLNENLQASPTDITERGVRVVGHILETPPTSEIISQMNQEQEVTNFVYKNLSQMLSDYNKSLDDLLGLIK